MRYETMQGQMLKSLKIWKYYVDLPTKIYKCLKKFPALKNSNLSLYYFRNHFKLIKTICKSNEELFSKKKNSINGFISSCF